MAMRTALRSSAPNSRGPAGPVLLVMDRVVPRSNVISFASSPLGRGFELVPAPSAKRLMGRKGRAALAKRRALDGAFITAAVGTVALLWWTAF